MSKILILTALIAAATALPLNSAPTALGIDSTHKLTDRIASCLKKGGVSAAFFQISDRVGNDLTGVENAKIANNAGLKIEFFVTPKIFGGYAAQQLYDVADFAQRHGINLTRVWLKATSPVNWENFQGNNVNFIKDFVLAASVRKIKVGLFTNWYDYKEITGNSPLFANHDLWYWHALGAGASAETSKDFSDFRTFGPFRGWPLAKQYGIEESVCNYQTNVNVFAASSLASNSDNSIPIGEGAAFIKGN
ncbi:unnamed protein product [Bursaphelenchus xylophilus]|uniref:(pine wood nematode) hypothetical protein n=1 Tax=Bursaphelenchus xylophilus TaxID=6326 RepID=A0A1I7RWW0_BURXY|nr:unnamed protein product [Bursaphelenchus xylophilus]CAG9121151.1 unnamed protein product [Bursaphelenchus xylophilus]